MNNYIEIKVIVWNRLHFDRYANMQGIADLVKENGIAEVMDEKLGFVESETLYDTEQRLAPAENNGEATIEVYENGKKIWTNLT